jgi:tetratricopeptide (TPR) repeat protein
MMNKLLKIFLFFPFCCLTAYSQTLEEAKNLFINKQYQVALPAFKKLVSQQPANPNYNYWYGTCLLKTGSAKQAVKYLEFADKRKVGDAPLYLGQAYEELYQFDNATTCYETFRNQLLKRKESTSEIDKLITRSKNGQNMLLGVEKVCVIDSFQVDKERFLSAYKLSKECGKLYMYKDFFQGTDSCNSTVYENERGNRIYYGGTNNGYTNLYTRIKTTDSWSAPILLPTNINTKSNVNYPFLMDDGVTIYYASDGSESMGGYDIFVTRYDTDNDSYLKPESAGLPFNSPFNDYLLAIDEYNNLGWFVSDRYQPKDKVCVYVYVPNSTKQIYDNNSMDPNKIIRLAQLRSIKDTWFDEQEVKNGLARLNDAMNTKVVEKKKKKDFDFVINDQLTYHHIADFRSSEALQEFKTLLQLKNSYQQLEKKLQGMRNQFSKADENTRSNLSPAIIDLEKRVLQLETEVHQQTVKVRNIENRNINK